MALEGRTGGQAYPGWWWASDHRSGWWPPTRAGATVGHDQGGTDGRVRTVTSARASERGRVGSRLRVPCSSWVGLQTPSTPSGRSVRRRGAGGAPDRRVRERPAVVGLDLAVRRHRPHRHPDWNGRRGRVGRWLGIIVATLAALLFLKKITPALVDDPQRRPGHPRHRTGGLRVREPDHRAEADRRRPPVTPARVLSVATPFELSSYDALSADRVPGEVERHPIGGDRDRRHAARLPLAHDVAVERSSIEVTSAPDVAGERRLPGSSSSEEQ